jgi:hypothetical protein
VIVVEPTATREKLSELLAEGSETAELDYKATIDLNSAAGTVAVAKDIAAMSASPNGGYLVIGSDDHGQPATSLDDVQSRLLDEATLRSKMLNYMSEPLHLVVGIHEVNEHRYALIFVGPRPDGFAVMERDGDYSEGSGRQRQAFRAGDVFVRHGTASEKWRQADAAAIIDRIMEGRKEAWRRDTRDDFLALVGPGLAAQRLAKGPAQALDWRLDEPTFEATVVELLRADDDVPIELLTRRVVQDVRGWLFGTDERVHIEQSPTQDARADLSTLLDRLTCLAALAILLKRPRYLQVVLDSLADIYDAASDSRTSFAGGLLTALDVWIGIVERLYSLGGLSVRLRRWDAIKVIATTVPRRGDFAAYPSIYRSWLRHAQVQAARSGQLGGASGDQDGTLGLIPRAHNQVRRLDCLHPDLPTVQTGTTGDEDPVLDSLCQFDAYAAFAVVGATGDVGSGSFYTNFARYYQRRTMPAFTAMVEDLEVRRAVFGDDDQLLADAIRAIDRMATTEGARYDGWWGLERYGAITTFLSVHPPANR